MPTDKIKGSTREDAASRFQKRWPNRVIRVLRKVKTVGKDRSGDHTYRCTWHHRGEKPSWVK